MQNSKSSERSKVLTYFGLVASLLITGIGIGWLIGLSVSPVVSIVITSVTGSAAAVVAVLSGLEKERQWSVNPWPLAVLIAGLVSGSMIGIEARNQDWLGRDITAEVNKWTAPDLGLPKTEVVNRIFEATYPAGGNKDAPAGRTNPGNTVLFSGRIEDECVFLLARRTEELPGELEISGVAQLRKLPEIISDPPVLERVIKEVICADGG